MAQMTVIALSINGGIKTLGSYAGLAAVVALALLSLLYFSQARELKRLREFIEREAQRQRLQPPPAPVQAPAAPAAAGPPPPVPAPAPVAAGVGAVQTTPLLAPTVAGVRRVPIPGGAAAGGTAVLPGLPPPPTPPDATTVSEPAAADGGPAQIETPPASRLIAERVLGLEPGSAHDIGDGVLLGRGKAASIRLADRLASARHARVAPDGDGIILEDLGSTNGTFLNGVQLSAPAALQSGDHIRLGESEFVFESAPRPAPPLPPAPAEAETSVVLEASGADGADGATGAQASSAAVPLLATPVAERTLELSDEDAEGPLPPAPPPTGVPAPHPDSPGIGVVASQPAPIARRPRRAPPAEDGVAEPRRRSRRLRGTRGEFPTTASRRLLLAAAVFAVLVIAAVVVLLTNGGGTKTPAHRTAPPTPAASTKPTTTPPARSSVTVAVLNGTSTPGAAGQLSAQLVADGFAKGTVADATSPVATTTVNFTPGNKSAAEEVAGALHLGRGSVTAASSATDATASVGGRLPRVVVTIGAK
jgi:hypothetical protein